MAPLECALADSLIRPMTGVPTLTIVVPSFHRPNELIQTVTSLCDQLKDGLEAKVEILISDNGSGLDTIETIKGLAQRYAVLGYMLNARDEGGFFNFLAAPWRARGRYTWVFGSDDLLMEGGIANVVAALEREQPSFLTMNQRVVNASITQSLTDAMNTCESRAFPTMGAMFSAFGINQFAFITAQVDRTDAARKLDYEHYLRANTRHPHVAAFLEKHWGKPAYYLADTHLVHRNDNSPMLEYHAGNFFDFGVTLPCVLVETGKRVRAPAGFLEQATGRKQIANYDAPDVTVVDAIFENQLRALSFGRYMTVGQKRTLEDMLSHCRADRLAQFEQIWAYSQQLDQLDRNKVAAEAALNQARQAALQTSAIFTQPTNV
jgi:glycosyltransferase involved in cell wall biosynthesis